MENRGNSFHSKVRQGYLTLAENDSERIKVVPAGDDINKAYSIVREEVYDFIKRHYRPE